MVSERSRPWHCWPGGYFLPLLSNEGLPFSGRFADAADFEYEDFAADSAGLEGFLLGMRDKMARGDVEGKRRIASISRPVWLKRERSRVN